MRELDVTLPGGGVLHAYDTGPSSGATVLWHHGTPNIGVPPADPLAADTKRLDLRWVGYDRPGYGGSSPAPGRDVASAAAYGVAVADALGIPRFAVMGHSGGGPHALAVAALVPDRVRAVVVAASLAPYAAPRLGEDGWFAGMATSGVATLRAAAAGREAKLAHEAAHGDDYDPEFTASDLAAFEGPWGWFGGVVRAGSANGPAPAIEDDLAYAAPWGADPAQVRAPTLLLHGLADRVVPPAHGRWLADAVPGATLRTYDGLGHISVLTHAGEALAWLATRSGP